MGTQHNNLTTTCQEQQFTEVVNIIVQHRSKASRTVNEQALLCAWYIGGYVSKKLKSEEWGSKIVTQLSEHIRTKHPDLKGFSRRNIYNMVMLYDEYSSEAFAMTVAKYLKLADMRHCCSWVDFTRKHGTDALFRITLGDFWT